MNRHRNIISSAGLLAAIMVATPVAAHASPLLSGYGGPGQGSQLILGSSLLGGPGAYPARQAAPPALGVSQQDLLYIVLALCILAVAGVLTRRLTYPRGGPARGAEQ